jgi:two-component system cell cycle sensor histidine kinase PleC
MLSGTFSLKSKLRIGTEVIVTFPPERVMSALAPITEAAPPLQPQGDNAAPYSSGTSSASDASSRAKRALFGAGG